MKRLLPLFCSLLLFGACSFDYGDDEGEGEEQPDIVMREVEYVRVRDGEPTVRFQAERAERYEQRQTMELKNFSFEQFGSGVEDVNAQGRAGAASVELDSGNIRLGEGVRIEIESEDITIETGNLDWKDEERVLAGGQYAEVNIHRADGTSFTGRGFSANARSRTWEFSAGVEGSYFYEDEDEEELPEASETEAPEPGPGGDFPEPGEIGEPEDGGASALSAGGPP
jgi:LPS export ABC transporter protein LptC